MSISSLSSIGSSALRVLNATLGVSKQQSTVSPANLSTDDPRKSSSSSESIDKFELTDRSQDKLLEAAKAYLNTIELVNILRGDKESGISKHTFEKTEVTAGNGNDLITVHKRSIVNAGNGDNTITAFGGGQINTGTGRDVIRTHSNTQINAGSGDDQITSYGTFSQINAGDGADQITSFGFSQVNAGNGNDIITAFGSGPVNGEDGNDTIVSYGAFAKVNAGSGDDVITAGALSNVTGGAGDDKINLIGAGVTVNFNAGDGHDEIKTANDVTINIGEGLDFKDAKISQETGKAVVTFNNQKEKLTINLQNGAIATLTFQDGQSIKL